MSKKKNAGRTAFGSAEVFADPREIVDPIDVREGPEVGVDVAQGLNRNEPTVEGTDHRPEREVVVILEIPANRATGIDRVEWLEHSGPPAWDHGLVVVQEAKEAGDDTGVDAGHIAGDDEESLARGSKRPGVEPADGAQAPAPVDGAPDRRELLEPRALDLIAGHEKDLIRDRREGSDQPVEEGLAPQRKEVLSRPPARVASPPTRTTADRLTLSPARQGFTEPDQICDAGVDRRGNPVPGADSDDRAVHEIDLGSPAARKVLKHRRMMAGCARQLRGGEEYEVRCRVRPGERDPFGTCDCVDFGHDRLDDRPGVWLGEAACTGRS